jgi:hypothetical protein
MRKLLLLLVTLITFTNVSYASFPVNQNTQTEIIETIESPSYGNSQPNWDKIFQILGWLSLIFSVVNFIIALNIILQFFPAILDLEPEILTAIPAYVAIIFGIPGLFRKRSRMLSIRSLSLFILSILMLVVWLIILIILYPPWTW